ncbi:unnamed protein product [Ectocarpus sp. 13 AM-2016]
MSGSTSNHQGSRRQDELTALKVRKLGQQEELAKEFNFTLTRQGGLNDQARQTCKNLEYAIAIATRPGQIEYYRPSEEAARIVANGELAVLTNKIVRLQRDIDQAKQHCQVEQDIQQAGAVASSTAAAAHAQSPASPPCSSLAEWFAAYGEPARSASSGMMTNFEESPKIYGGTNHHRAFKTQATVMKKGRITR